MSTLSGDLPTAGSPTSAPEKQSMDAQGSYWPTKGWHTCTPEEQHMDSQKLTRMLEAVKEKQVNLHSLLVIRNGYIVSETYFQSYDETKKHELYSCTKSFISTLVGIAIDKGYIDKVDRPVLDFFPDRSFENRDVRKDAMTLEDLLTMRSGLHWTETMNPDMGRSRDWVKFVLDQPMQEKPGTLFNYCSGCSHVVSAILQRKTGMNTRDFAQKELFEPLGISSADWETDPTDVPLGGWGLQLTPRDMAKLGYLYLHNGMWDGQQVVSAEWVKTATQMHVKTGTRVGIDYGYMWWTCPSLNAYAALGYDGQTIFVIPNLDLVIVATAQTVGHEHDEIFELIEEYIVPAVQKS
jgi:CubicO group peptidase (beta-lactamase class C family)